MRIIVQKFGGTSLNSLELRKKAVSYIKQRLAEGFLPVVVVSAMGRNGEPYATDTLLQTALVEYNDINLREKDLLLSCGEIISSVVMVQSLKAGSIDAVALSGTQAGIITNSVFGSSRVIKFFPEKVLEIINSKKIPVVAGYQGTDENGEITTLGRGGSDTTASVIAASLNAEYIEIFSDIEGIQTADPKIIKKADLIKNCNYDEIVELANEGAKVIHPRAIEIASNSNIPIKVRSTITGSAGTYIHNISHDRPVTGIISKNGIIFVNIIPNNKLDIPEELDIFQELSQNNISVDFIDIREDGISFIIEKEHKKIVEKTLENKQYSFTLKDGFVKVSVVGSGMTGQPGVMAKIVRVLSNNKIKIYECTDSHTTISCLIDISEEEKAIKVLHKGFIED